METNIVKKNAIDSIKLQICDELGSTEVGLEDNLIEKGLSSIMIMKISNKLRKSGIGIPFAKLMEYPSIKEWEDFIKDVNVKSKSKEKASLSSQKSANEYIDVEFPLTDVQYAYWIGREDGQALGGVGCHAYLEIDGEYINPETLNNAWNKLQKGHPMLRAKFNANGTQKIMKLPYSERIGVYDYTFLSQTETENQLAGLREQLSHRKLQVEKGEVAGLNIALLPEGKTRILLDVDLLVADVMSLSIMIRELADIYSGTYEPSFSGYTFKDYMEERVTDESVLEEDKQFWAEK